MGAVSGSCRREAADNSIIDSKDPFFIDPGHQVIAVHQRPDIDITGVVSKNRREKVPRHRSRRSDLQFTFDRFRRTLLSKDAADNR